MSIYKEGDILQLTIPLVNNGALVATNVEVTVVLPTGLIYSSDTPSDGTYTSGTGVWAVPTLVSGASETLLLELEVDTVCDAPYTVTWTATADQTDPDVTNNSDSYTFSEDSCCEVRDCYILTTKQVWVDFGYGDDTIGSLENRQKPYATLSAALTDVIAHASPTGWTVHLIGSTGAISLTEEIPQKTVFQFYNNEFGGLTLNDGYGPTLRGRINISNGTSIYAPVGALDSLVILDNLMMVTVGSTPIDDSDAVVYINIGSSTNYTGGFSNVTFENESLNVLPNLV